MIELTDDIELINKIMNNSLIYQMANGSGVDAPFNKSNTEELKELGFKFLAVYNNKDLIGMINIRPLTKICLEVHINILPEYHKVGLGKKAHDEGLIWTKANTEFLSVMTYVPENCFHVLKFMQDNKWKAQGVFKDAIIYNNELTNLLMFQRGIS